MLAKKGYFFFPAETHIAFNLQLEENASFQQFPLQPKQMSDISDSLSPVHEASRRIILLVFWTNVRNIKNSTPQTGVTQVHVELLWISIWYYINPIQLQQDWHVSGTTLVGSRWQECVSLCVGLCFLAMLAGMCGTVCVKQGEWIYMSWTMLVG